MDDKLRIKFSRMCLLGQVVPAKYLKKIIKLKIRVVIRGGGINAWLNSRLCNVYLSHSNS